MFTAGIGGHAVAVRRGIVARLAALSVAPLPARDAAEGDVVLSETGASVAVVRVEAREDLVIAGETAAFVSG